MRISELTIAAYTAEQSRKSFDQLLESLQILSPALYAYILSYVEREVPKGTETYYDEKRRLVMLALSIAGILNKQLGAIRLLEQFPGLSLHPSDGAVEGRRP